MAGEQTKYAQRGRDLSTIFANLSDDMLNWRNVYWDRGYNNTMTDAKVAGADVTAADVQGLITFADALETFLVANRAYVNKMRGDM